MLKTHWLTARRFGTAVALTTDEEVILRTLVAEFRNLGAFEGNP
jgi:hypothetical protein